MVLGDWNAWENCFANDKFLFHGMRKVNDTVAHMKLTDLLIIWPLTHWWLAKTQRMGCNLQWVPHLFYPDFCKSNFLFQQQGDFQESIWCWWHVAPHVHLWTFSMSRECSCVATKTQWWTATGRNWQDWGDRQDQRAVKCMLLPKCFSTSFHGEIVIVTQWHINVTHLYFSRTGLA